MKHFPVITACALATVAITATNAAVPAQPCQSLASLRLQHTAITFAEVVPAGGFTRPALDGQTPYERLIAKTRVEVNDLGPFEEHAFGTGQKSAPAAVTVQLPTSVVTVPLPY